MWQTASDVKAATDARNKTLIDQYILTQKHIEGLEPSELGKNPLWINALANSKDVVDAANKIRKNPDF